MRTIELPATGYTVTEAEQILGLQDKYLYKLIRLGKVDSYVDCVGQMRVSREAVYAYMKNRK
jgi:excisionase family DNA binding protein